MPTKIAPPRPTRLAPQRRPVHEPRQTTPRKPSRAQQDQARLAESFFPERLHRRNIDWVIVGWMALMHVGALAAPFYFSWSALGIVLLLHWLTASIGICLGYHRYLAHKSLRLAAPAEFFVLLCGALSGEGSPLTWSATHRLHHQKSDKKGDPHSPLDGPWWSHMWWLFVNRTKEERQLLFDRYVPELQNRRMLQFFERTNGLWLILTGAVLFALGGLPWLLWGLCVRMVVVYHGTWFVNSATHLWGYRNYDTRDESRNLWWVAILTYGEGWHNNHHAHPSLAPAGHRWWEIDMTMWAIRTLKFCRLAYDVRDQVPAPADRTTTEATEPAAA